MRPLSVFFVAMSLFILICSGCGWNKKSPKTPAEEDLVKKQEAVAIQEELLVRERALEEEKMRIQVIRKAREKDEEDWQESLKKGRADKAQRDYDAIDRWRRADEEQNRGDKILRDLKDGYDLEIRSREEGLADFDRVIAQWRFQNTDEARAKIMEFQKLRRAREEELRNLKSKMDFEMREEGIKLRASVMKIRSGL